jgi:beta-glucanase (GH16 family)
MTGSYAAGQKSTATTPVTNGATLLWFDHFEDAANAPMPATWSPDLTGENQNLQANVAANAYHDGSSNLLVITNNNTSGSYSYTGVQIFGGTNRVVPNPGYVEFRAKMPMTPGTWPTLWTMGKNGTGSPPVQNWPTCGETDIIENLPAASTSNGYATLHFPGSSGAAQYGGAALAASTIAYDSGYHTWGAWWQGSQISMYRDGVLYWTATQSQVTATSGNTWEWSSLQQVPLISHYVGGSGAGTPPAGTSWPVMMQVDYVTCWSKPPFV